MNTIEANVNVPVNPAAPERNMQELTNSVKELEQKVQDMTQMIEAVVIPRSGNNTDLQGISVSDVYEGTMFMLNDGSEHFPLYAHIDISTIPNILSWWKADGTQYTIPSA